MQIGQPAKYLRKIKQLLWRGQDYSSMEKEAHKIVLCKYLCEEAGVNFTVWNMNSIWNSQSFVEDFGLIETYPDNRLEELVLFMDLYEISGNTELRHMLLKTFVTRAIRKENGQYFTPPLVRQFMVNVYKPDVSDKICDPCGGSGGFLMEAADQIKTLIPDHFYYFDIDERHARMTATTALRMYGRSLAQLNMETMDSLASEWPCQMDKIYTNVPFGLVVRDRNVLKRYETGTGKSQISQILFMEKCLKQLSDKGRFATVVDKGVATNDKHARARRLLTRHGYLELVVELPGSAFEKFAGTTFPTYLLFFSKQTVDKTKFAFVKGLRETWNESDLPRILHKLQEGSLPSVDYNLVAESGNWHYGAYISLAHKGKRLYDIATFIKDPWNGSKPELNPTVDRKFRIVTETHLRPKTKTITLRSGCLLLNRIMAQEPACAIIDDYYDGAGATNENYILKPNHPEDLALIWCLINFDKDTQEFLRLNVKGQGRGRIKPIDLMNMPIKDVENLDDAERCCELLEEKCQSDRRLKGKLNEL